MDVLRHGDPIRLGDTRITPVWSVRVEGTPIGPAVLVQGRVRPVAVIVETPAGRQTLPIPPPGAADPAGTD